MPSSFWASRSISMRLASAATPSTKNGFSASFIAAPLSLALRALASPAGRSPHARVEALLAGLAVLRQELPQRLDDPAQLGVVAALDRRLALGDQAPRQRRS